MAERVNRFPETLTSLIGERGYHRNRQPVLDAVGISASALSQYERGQANPTLPRLLALADFFGVSLDYLVFGTPHWALATSQPEVMRPVREALDDMRALTTAHTALVGRVGRMLADRIDEATREAVRESAVEGLVSDDEIARLEAHAARADILTIDLDANVLSLADGEDVAGTFLEVVALAIQRGCTYRFVVSSRPHTRDESVAAFRRLLAAQIGPDLTDRRCAIRRAVVPTVTGMGLYRLDLPALRSDDPGLLSQFADAIDDGGWFGYLIRPQQAADKDSVMNARRRDTARGWFETLWADAEPVR